MLLQHALGEFYTRSGFKLILGQESSFVEVFVGRFRVPLPNVRTRQKYIKYHDLHHVVTGYNATKIGEGEMSAWELGTGSTFHPVLAFMNLIAFATGLMNSPRRMLKAFLRGCDSRNLYSPQVRRRIDNGELNEVEQLRQVCFEGPPRHNALPVHLLRFGLFILVSMVLHCFIWLPALFCQNIWVYLLETNAFSARLLGRAVMDL